MGNDANKLKLLSQRNQKPIPVAVRFKASVCVHTLAGIVDSSPAGLHRCLSVVNVVCCQAEVSSTGQRSPTDCVCFFVILYTHSE